MTRALTYETFRDKLMEAGATEAETAWLWISRKDEVEELLPEEDIDRLTRIFSEMQPLFELNRSISGHDDRMAEWQEKFKDEPIIENIMTKEDGEQPLIWKQRHHFNGRKMTIQSLDENLNPTSSKTYEIPDDQPVLCDFCNHEITEFPVPVLCNSYALCPDCFGRIKANGENPTT